ncbi:MAG: hypothetical protein M1826_001632 [Phylliscum demangeonii]|nr:MAG: hypothetical protein M1826_001632 [Phylliscum demangeonii]
MGAAAQDSVAEPPLAHATPYGIDIRRERRPALIPNLDDWSAQDAEEFARSRGIRTPPLVPAGYLALSHPPRSVVENPLDARRGEARLEGNGSSEAPDAERRRTASNRPDRQAAFGAFHISQLPLRADTDGRASKTSGFPDPSSAE